MQTLRGQFHSHENMTDEGLKSCRPVTCMGWFNVLMTEFIVACVTGYYFPPNPPLSTPATQAKFIVVTGRKDGVDLVLIYRYVVIFIARFGYEKEVTLQQMRFSRVT